MIENRLIGSLPKIGIRPAIDGRLGGVRESLEQTTLDLAKSVATLIEKKVRHANGAAVECVIPEFCIGGIAESAKTAELFAKEQVGLSLTVSPCWCYGAETMDMDPHTPKAVWGFNGTERPGAVYLAAVLAAHASKGVPAFGIYGKDVMDAGDLSIPEDVEEKILRFIRAGLAVATMRGKSYLSLGGISMGIVGSLVDHEFFEAYLGMRVEAVDMSEVTRRLERGIYDEKELTKAVAWVKANCTEGQDYNPPENQLSREEKDDDWEISIKMALITRDLMVGNKKLEDIGYGEEALGRNAIAAGFQGQRQWTDHFPNGDFMEAILNSSFDWNGVRQPYIVATENDALNGVCMLMGHLLTGTAQLFADLRTYWSPDAVKRVTNYTLEGRAADGILHLINSGPAALDCTGEMTESGKPAVKPHWDVTEKDAEACLKATTWHCGMLEYFRGGGWSTRFKTKGGMPATMFRINLVHKLGPVLQIAEGETIELPDEVHDTLDGRTNPTWPTTWFVPYIGNGGAFESVYTVMNNWGSNHCVMSYGHIGADLISLAALLRIPVHMHNVPEDRVFRPKAWASYGTDNPEGADFRACEQFGPLYK